MRLTPNTTDITNADQQDHGEGTPVRRKGLKAVAGGVALAVALPAVALAATPFDDVDPSAFYADAVEWAYDNGITTGTSATTFEPDANVTRGQNVTFAKRYHDNIAQPEFEAIHAELDGLDIPVVHSARVSAAGGVVDAGTSDGTSATTTGTGRYVVTFPGDVTDCSWSVVHRTPGGSLIPLPNPDYTDEPHFEVSTRHEGVFPNSSPVSEDVQVLVTDSAGTQKNTEFQLQVIC